MSVRRCLIISLGEDRYAIDLSFCKEIVPLSTITPVPAMPEFFDGLVHLRGFLLPLLSLGALVGIPSPAKPEGTSKIVIVAVRHRIAGLRVDDVEDIVEVADEDLMHAPAVLCSLESNYLAGGFRFSDHSILVLDIERLISEKVLRENPQLLTSRSLQS